MCDTSSLDCGQNVCKDCQDGKLFDNNFAQQIDNQELDEKLNWSKWDTNFSGFLEKMPVKSCTRDVVNQPRVLLWTDGTSSQYKNKYIFSLLPHLQLKHQLSITWNYFATSHGKGPCDAIGGNVKRIARRMVMAGRKIVNDANTFCEALHLSQTAIIHKGISASDITRIINELKLNELWEQMKTKSMPGTINTHCVAVVEFNAVERKLFTSAADAVTSKLPYLLDLNDTVLPEQVCEGLVVAEQAGVVMVPEQAGVVMVSEQAGEVAVVPP